MKNDYPYENFKNKSIVIREDQFISPIHISISHNHSNYIEKIIVSEGLIKDRIKNLAQKIIKDYANETVYFLIILKGAAIFSTNLCDSLSEILRYDNQNKMRFFFEYFQISSYLNKESTGDIKICTDLDILNKLRNNNVIIVEDIYDSGISMDKLIRFIEIEYTPKILKTCVLFQKMNIKNLKFESGSCIDYLGFLVPDVFLIGFGIDYNEEFRDLNHLCMINELGVEIFKK